MKKKKVGTFMFIFSIFLGAILGTFLFVCFVLGNEAAFDFPGFKFMLIPLIVAFIGLFLATRKPQ